MDFDFSDDQKSLKGEARKFLDARCTSQTVRAVLDDPAKAYDRDLWRGVAELGWLGAGIPETYGGLGLGHIELCAIAEEIGRALAPIPFRSTVYFIAEALMIAGSRGSEEPLAAEDRRRRSDRLLSPPSNGQGHSRKIRSRPASRAASSPASSCRSPTATSPTSPWCWPRKPAKPGCSWSSWAQGARETLEDPRSDPRRGQADFHRRGGRAAGRGGRGLALAEQMLDRAAVLFAFEQVGGADRALEMAKDYALERYAFGRPIGSYQAIKHKLADMYVKTELARSNAYYGAWALTTERRRAAAAAAAAARVAATEAFWYAAKENIQTHGGMGFTWEVDCHLF